MDPQKYCHEFCKRKRSNFLYAARVLRRPQREALEAFYAFCASVDHAVDDTTNKHAAREKLSYWRMELDRSYVSEPKHPIMQALAPPLASRKVPKQYLEEIINGCAMDVDKSEYAPFSELELYCYRVASCVGLVCLYFFDIPPTSQAERAATAMGKALQLTNIIRDIVEDAKRGRIYIPEEDLKHCNLSREDLHGQNHKEGMGKLLEMQIGRAKNFFREAFGMIPQEKHEHRKWFPALLMAYAYEALLRRIEKAPFAVLHKKLTISPWQKVRVIGKTVSELYLH